jgi:hypothetical protein
VSSALERLIPETLIVTGHPNHELAILGIIQRVRPQILFLTDGGGEERVAESRAVFEHLGLSDRTRFLKVSEGDLYRALLERDSSILSRLVAEARSMIDAVGPRQILCESAEFYNPLHDLTLPVVRAAARHRPDITILEFPLIAEIPGSGGRFRVQRPPPSRESAAWKIRLTARELAVKLEAAAHRYPSLRLQMGRLLDEIPPAHAALEYFLEASPELPAPGAEHALRYEERGRSLRRRGLVEHTITLSDHFLPMVAALEAS